MLIATITIITVLDLLVLLHPLLHAQLIYFSLYSLICLINCIYLFLFSFSFNNLFYFWILEIYFSLYFYFSIFILCLLLWRLPSFLCCTFSSWIFCLLCVPSIPPQGQIKFYESWILDEPNLTFEIFFLRTKLHSYTSSSYNFNCPVASIFS